MFGLFINLGIAYQPRWNPHRGSSRWHVVEDNRICSDSRAIPDHYPPEDLGPRPNIDAASNSRNPRDAGDANRHLSGDQAIWSNHGIWMDHHTIGVGEQQPAADPRIDRYVRRTNDAPEAVLEHRQLAEQRAEDSPAMPPFLVTAYRAEEATRRIPIAPSALLPRPIRKFRFGGCLHPQHAPIVAQRVMQLGELASSFSGKVIEASKCSGQHYHSAGRRDCVAPPVLQCKQNRVFVEQTAVCEQPDPRYPVD